MFVISGLGLDVGVGVGFGAGFMSWPWCCPEATTNNEKIRPADVNNSDLLKL